MEAVVNVDAGECGFHTCARAFCEDGRNVIFEVSSECEKIRNLGKVLKYADPFDAYLEITPGTNSRLLAVCSDSLPSCCVGCAVQLGLTKAMKIAAGLALPKDIIIRLSRG